MRAVLPRTLQSLRWKLTLSAAATMAVAVALVMTAFVVRLSWSDQRRIRDSDLRRPLEIEADALARQLASVLEGPGATERAANWLTSREGSCDLGLIVDVAGPTGDARSALIPLSSMVITDPSGEVLAGSPAETFAPGRVLAAAAPPSAAPLLGSARRGRTAISTPDDHDADAILAAAPVLDDAGTLLGILYFEADAGPLSLAALGRRVVLTLRENAMPLVPLVAVVALLLGALSSSGLLWRLRRLRQTGTAWARGDLAARADDGSGDELGSLARELDDMAARLATLIDARRRLATLEARNTLAHDLHDTVKQNVFSISMLLASVETQLERDPAGARAALARARDAAHECGRELVTLIDQLRPERHEIGGLSAALRALTETWSATHGLRIELALPDHDRLPGAVANDLLLVAREALTNVARHGGARRVELTLAIEPRDDGGDLVRVRLTLRDDGVGFDAARGYAGLGLESMRARMASLGGRLDVETTPGHGTTVVASLDRVAVGDSVPDEEDRGVAA